MIDAHLYQTAYVQMVLLNVANVVLGSVLLFVSIFIKEKFYDRDKVFGFHPNENRRLVAYCLMIGLIIGGFYCLFQAAMSIANTEYAVLQVMSGLL